MKYLIVTITLILSFQAHAELQCQIEGMNSPIATQNNAPEIGLATIRSLDSAKMELDARALMALVSMELISMTREHQKRSIAMASFHRKSTSLVSSQSSSGSHS